MKTPSILLIAAAALLLLSKKQVSSDTAGVAALNYTTGSTFDQAASNTLIDYVDQLSNKGTGNLDIFNKLVDNYNNALGNTTSDTGFTMHEGELVPYSTNHDPPAGSKNLVWSDGGGIGNYGPGFYPKNFNFNSYPGVQGYDAPNQTSPIGYTYTYGPTGAAQPVY